MKKKKWFTMLITPLLLMVLLLPASPVAAHEEFYAAGQTYNMTYQPAFLHGSIETVVVNDNRSDWTKAGIELDIQLTDGTDNYNLEIISWYYGKDYFRNGFVLYKNGAFYSADREQVDEGDTTSWLFYINETGFGVYMENEANEIIANSFWAIENCEVTTVESWIECYFDDNETGDFYYYGYIYLVNDYSLKDKADRYYQGYWGEDSPILYHIHDNYASGWYDKGEVDYND